METKVSVRRMEGIKRKCGFQHGIDVGADGSKGGLMLGWRDHMIVVLRSYSYHRIDFMIQDNDDGFSWGFTGFYGHPKERFREISWYLLW